MIEEVQTKDTNCGDSLQGTSGRQQIGGDTGRTRMQRTTSRAMNVWNNPMLGSCA